MKIKDPTPEVYILSAAKRYYSEQGNRGKHASLVEQLRHEDVPFKEVFGTYEGHEERAVVIPGRYAEQAIQLGQQYDQDVILRIDEDRVAYAVDPYYPVDETCLGRFVGKSKPLPGKDYTYCPYVNCYYVIEEE